MGWRLDVVLMTPYKKLILRVILGRLYFFDDETDEFLKKHFRVTGQQNLFTRALP